MQIIQMLEAEAMEEAGNITITCGMQAPMSALLLLWMAHMNRIRINLMAHAVNAVVVTAVALVMGPMVVNRAVDSSGH